eukprot:Awhi_evm1s683
MVLKNDWCFEAYQASVQNKLVVVKKEPKSIAQLHSYLTKNQINVETVFTRGSIGFGDHFWELAWDPDFSSKFRSKMPNGSPVLKEFMQNLFIYGRSKEVYWYLESEQPELICFVTRQDRDRRKFSPEMLINLFKQLTDDQHHNYKVQYLYLGQSTSYSDQVHLCKKALQGSCGYPWGRHGSKYGVESWGLII